MERTIDETHVQELLAKGISEREIARQLDIPRTTLKRHIAKLNIPVVHKGTHDSVPLAAELAASQDDLQEMLAWWQERKQLTQTSSDPERETERKTYHVEKRHIEAIERAADLERVSITEIVNRAFSRYFTTP